MPDGPGDERCDSVALARFLLSAAAANGADPHRLAQEAELASWALAVDTGSLAATLGCGDVRSVRRPMRRWKDQSPLDSPH